MPRKIQTQADRERARAYGRDWYQKNSERVKARKAENQTRLLSWFRDYKSRLRCKHCGENDLAALDFHHREPSDKEVSITRAIHDGWGIQRVLIEVAKCDILCANCHRRLHRATH